MNQGDIGKIGEDFCCNYFKKRGFFILKRNYHSRNGEIDLIVENENFLVFVEVKTRSDKKIGEARDAVDYSKQRKIALTAIKYLSENGMRKQPRFDVFEVLHHNGKIYKFNHIENAFQYDESFGGKSNC